MIIPPGLMERTEAAIERITSGQAPMRIPVDSTDPDIVLSEWLKAARPAPASGDHDYRTDLQCYFSLSYASWLTLPRVLMQAMPESWQSRMAVLLHEYDDAIQNPPDLATSVNISQGGKRIKAPAWLNNYRHPDREMIAQVFGAPAKGEQSYPQEAV